MRKLFWISAILSLCLPSFGAVTIVQFYVPPYLTCALSSTVCTPTLPQAVTIGNTTAVLYATQGVMSAGQTTISSVTGGGAGAGTFTVNPQDSSGNTARNYYANASIDLAVNNSATSADTTFTITRSANGTNWMPAFIEVSCSPSPCILDAIVTAIDSVVQTTHTGADLPITGTDTIFTAIADGSGALSISSPSGASYSYYGASDHDAAAAAQGATSGAAPTWTATLGGASLISSVSWKVSASSVRSAGNLSRRGHIVIK